MHLLYLISVDGLVVLDLSRCGRSLQLLYLTRPSPPPPMYSVDGLYALDVSQCTLTQLSYLTSLDVLCGCNY